MVPLSSPLIKQQLEVLIHLTLASQIIVIERRVYLCISTLTLFALCFHSTNDSSLAITSGPEIKQI